MKSQILPEGKQERSDKAAPPYLPYSTFKNFLDSLSVGIPGQIDRSVMRTYSGTAQSMLIGALRFFDLINGDGKPAPMLAQLVQADAEKRKKLIGDLLRARYPFLFGGEVNLENATPRQLQAAFEDAGVSGDTVRKAMGFFLSAAKDAGLPVSPHLKVRSAPRNTGPRRKSGGPKGPAAEMREREDAQTEGTVRFSFPIPDKVPATIYLPGDVTTEDWEMVSTMVRAYIERRRKA